MADFIAVTLITGEEQIVNLDYVIKIEQDEHGSRITMVGDDTSPNQLTVVGSPFVVLRKSLISNV